MHEYPGLGWKEMRNAVMYSFPCKTPMITHTLNPLCIPCLSMKRGTTQASHAHLPKGIFRGKGIYIYTPPTLGRDSRGDHTPQPVAQEFQILGGLFEIASKIYTSFTAGYFQKADHWRTCFPPKLLQPTHVAQFIIDTPTTRTRICSNYKMWAWSKLQHRHT